MTKREVITDLGSFYSGMRARRRESDRVLLAGSLARSLAHSLQLVPFLTFPPFSLLLLSSLISSSPLNLTAYSTAIRSTAIQHTASSRTVSGTYRAGAGATAQVPSKSRHPLQRYNTIAQRNVESATKDSPALGPGLIPPSSLVLC